MAQKKAKPSLLRALAGDKNTDKIGTFKEATGGGTPLEKGEKLKDHPEAKRVQQPRDEEGKFTYNAANAKPLKYGPSRGTTIPPFLKGVKMTFAIKKGDKINYNGSIYLAGVDMTAKEFFNKCKEYIFGKGFEGVEDKVSAKKGKKSNEEKEIISKGETGIVGKADDKGQVEKYTTMTYEQFLSTIKSYQDKISNKKASEKVIKKTSTNKNNQSFNNNVSNKNLSEQAKNDPKQFLKDNKDSISEILKMVPDAKPSDIVEIMGSGDFKSFDELKKLIKENSN